MHQRLEFSQSPRTYYYNCPPCKEGNYVSGEPTDLPAEEVKVRFGCQQVVPTVPAINRCAYPPHSFITAVHADLSAVNSLTLYWGWCGKCEEHRLDSLQTYMHIPAQPLTRRMNLDDLPMLFSHLLNADAKMYLRLQ